MYMVIMNSLETVSIVLTLAAQNLQKPLLTHIITVLGALAKLRTATINFVVSVVLRTFPILLGSIVHSKGRNAKGYRPQVGKVINE